MGGKSDRRFLFRLFFQFMGFGFFTFGGGWSILAQLQKAYVDRQPLISNEELLDITSVSRSLPGAMICNVAMLFGFRLAGVVGGLICVLGLCLPSLAILCLISILYDSILTNPWFNAAMMGIRSAVVPIIAGAALKMSQGSFTLPPCLAVAVVCFVLYVFFGFNCVALVVIGGLSGLAISEYYERRGGRR